MSLRWNAIANALDAKLKTLPGYYPIHWPGMAFDPAKNGGSLYLRPTMIPARVDAAMARSGDTHEVGIYQVSVFAAAGQGEGTLRAAVDALSDHFDRAQLAGTGVTVQCSVPEPGPLLEEPNWLHRPVSIDFLAL